MPMKKKKTVPFWVVMVGLLAVFGGVYLYLSNYSAEQPTLGYSEDQVVYDKPFQAIHEMGGGSLIPFLAKDSPQPRIAVPEGTYNFGNIGPKAIVTYRFPVKNEGQAPLTISRAYTTCGCTTADFTARVIPPGKVSLVTLTFNAGFHDTRGQNVRRGLIIENNDPDQSKVEVWTRASVGN